MSFFKVENLGVRFGGVVAVDGVSFEVAPGEVYTIIGPNGAGKTTIFNLIGQIYPATSGRILFEDREVGGSPHHIAELGIARTFQNIELFEHATVLQNLLIGRHRHRATSLWQDLLFLGRRAQLRQRARSEGDRPARIAQYRDRWSRAAVRVLKVVESAGRCDRAEDDCCSISLPRPQSRGDQQRRLDRRHPAESAYTCW